MRRKSVAALVTALSLACGSGFASVVDQVSPLPNSSAISTSYIYHWQQEVVVGVAGRLSGISLYVTNTTLEFEGPQNDFNFGINLGPAFQVDANDFSTVVSTTLDWEFLFIDTSSASLFLNVGDTFVIDITPIPSSTVYGIGYQQNDNYLPGRLFLDGSRFRGDIIFMSHMEAVPEPATLALVGAALLGAVVSRRRTPAVLVA